MTKSTTLAAATLAFGLALAGCSTDGGSTTTTPAGNETGAGSTTDAGTTDGAATDDAAGTEAAGSTEDAGSTGAAAAPMSDEVCADFFQNIPVTLADRAAANREALASGGVTDPASWGEVNLLKQRIDSLVEDASGDQKALLERINAPFMEASAAVLDDPDASPSDAEITVPEIDVTDSEAAQDEFLASCSG